MLSIAGVEKKLSLKQIASISLPFSGKKKKKKTEKSLKTLVQFNESLYML